MAHGDINPRCERRTLSVPLLVLHPTVQAAPVHAQSIPLHPCIIRYPRQTRLQRVQVSATLKRRQVPAEAADRQHITPSPKSPQSRLAAVSCPVQRAAPGMHLVPVVAVQRVYVQAPPGHARQQPAGRQKHEAAADKGKSDLGAEEGWAEQAAKKKENKKGLLRKSLAFLLEHAADAALGAQL